MTLLLENERETLEVVEADNYFTIRLGHKASVTVRQKIENILGLQVTTLIDAREGLEFEEEEDVEEEEVFSKEEKSETEEAKGPVSSFQELIRMHEEAAQQEGDMSLPPIFSYIVPENVENEDFEEKKKLRLSEMENVCKQGPAKLCRSMSVWKGNKDMEERDRKWAEEKLAILRTEREALKEGKPTEALGKESKHQTEDTRKE